MEIGNILHGLLFYLVAAVVLGGALVTARARNLVYSALGLLFCLVGVAGIFVFAHADFVAIIEVIVYVGGILVLMLFGIMLTRREGGVKVPNPVTGGWMGRVIPIVVTALLLTVVLTVDWDQRFPDQGANPHLWSTYDVDAPADVKEVLETGDLLEEEVEPPTGRDLSEHEGSWGTLDTIGQSMMNKYLLAFEEVSILLLIALLGAAFLARRRTKKELDRARVVLEEMET